MHIVLQELNWAKFCYERDKDRPCSYTSEISPVFGWWNSCSWNGKHAHSKK